MLLNERYVGTFIWNKRKYVRVPGKKNRRAVERPRSEWVITEQPELAIITKDIWDTAQNRLNGHGSRGKKRGRPPESGKHLYLVSGLLRCGVCGGRMGVVGARTENNHRWPQYGCSTNRSRGNAICANTLTISEK